MGNPNTFGKNLNFTFVYNPLQRMKKIRIPFKLYMFLSLSFLLSSCSDIIYNSLWQGGPVKADGLPNEWSKPLKHYDSNTKLQYTFSNDRQNMYLCIRATDETTQKKILRGGLEIWIDTTGKNKERTGISYPLPDLTTREETDMEQRNQRGSDQNQENGEGYKRKKKFRNEKSEMQLTGFKSPVGGVVPLKNIYDIDVNMNIDSLDILTYEAIIPFKTFYRDSLQLSDSSRVMSFKIVVKGLPQIKKEGKDAGTSDNHDPTMGGGGMGSARQPGGGRGGRGGGPPSNPLFESQSIKSQIKLSVKTK
jgi:hypothetical protein